MNQNQILLLDLNNNHLSTSDPALIAWLNTYNQEGERIRLSALGSTTDYTRDIRGVISQISAATGTYDFSQDSLGRRTQLNLPNGASVNYGYDAAGQVTQIDHSGGINAQYGYSYDAAGRIIRWSGDGVDWDYQYDVASLLTNADHGSDNYAYTYDSVGNRLENGGGYDVANRLTEDNGYTYTYDVRGNLTQKQDKVSGARTVYTWNGRNQLVQVQHYPDAVAVVPDKTISYTYGPLDRRWSRNEDGVSEHYVYDGQDRIGTLDASNNPVSQVTFGQSIDEPLGADTPSGMRYYQANHQGSVMALMDDSSVAVAQNSYSPYGITTTNGEQANPFLYTGREWEMEVLYYYRARYYDPTTGRFISEDPIGFLSKNLNLYTYVGNNPINFTDPWGLCPCGKPQDVVKKAHDDTRDWGYTADRTDINRGFGPDTYKCNLFVDTSYENAGYNLPNIGGSWLSKMLGRYPPAAKNLSDSSYDVPGWPVALGPAGPGDLLAEGGMSVSRLEVVKVFLLAQIKVKLKMIGALGLNRILLYGGVHANSFLVF
jgi:RHS repeat-associated protein